DDYSMQNRTYRYFKGTPLYPFGFGLSYSKFTYSNLKLSKAKVGKNEPVSAELTVTNSGKLAGDEVVQLYLTHLNKKEDDPLYSLKGFQRIHLATGASKNINFTITPDMMKLVNEQGENILVPGTMKIIIGGSLPSARSEELGAAKPAEAVLSLR
ncbi:MAG: fibronectin type III-like domain-contianing protein, partial [Bacteroidota bacterium]|nr:fibronectin type III-like domain-contianing protein [Bacteroidota bacterium]